MSAKPLSVRFWEKVDKSGECWIWTSAVGSSLGYGVFWIGEGRSKYAHRVSWELTHGAEPPPGMCVMHSCDNPLCVRPEHLRLGTNADNKADCVAKKRHARGMNNGGRQNLTPELARFIRDSSLSQRKIAALLGVGKTTIAHVRANRIWKEGVAHG